MADDLRLSVVMATYNRAETIRETLRHLADQSLDPTQYEVIVIDDGSPDHTRVVVDEWMDRAPFKLTYLHHANRGPGYTENRGLEAARAPVVLLMADDIFMAHDTLAAHLAMHDANPEPEVAVLGRVEQSPTLDGNLFLRTWDPFRFTAFAGQTELPYYRFWACNISVKRDFVMRYGPFREQRGRAGAAAHEDPELGYRLSRGGLRILYAPAALGHHHHIVTFEQACKRAYMQGLNFPDFRDQVGQPEIAVAYHVFGPSTLRDHLQIWFGPRRRFVGPAERNPLRLLARYALRDLAFNFITVPLLWQTMLARAERNPMLARLVRANFYHGVIAHHFFRGCREGRAWTPAAQTAPRRA
jgi:glycosyltransferase involved in cell wall biosynthesis